MPTEAEMEVIHLKAKEFLQPPEGERGQETSFPRALGGSTVLLILLSNF